MPISRSQRVTDTLQEWFRTTQRNQYWEPINLSGESGPNGGRGQGPGGFIFRLSQRYVAYDTTEAESLSGSATLVDNLNHIRSKITALGPAQPVDEVERVWLWSWKPVF